VIDLERIRAIDVHTHVEVTRDGHDPMPRALREASAKYFKGEGATPTVDDVATHFREREMAAVVFTVDYESQSGIEPVPNEEVIAGAAEHDDVLIPFASVDPARADAVERVSSAIDAGARGFKFHPNLQAFFPNDRDAYPLYEVIEAAGLPALFHTGHSGIGSGVPGGGGIRLKYSNPIHVDDVAADFPGMPIVLAHPSFPWQDEAISMAMHKPQVHIDLSGWSPKYFPPQLVRYANTLLKHQVLFGSDFPMITPDRWLRDFEKVEIDDDVRPLVLKENAARLLGLG
jgi:predicted TIM-barrel fold metal-dependent hydrolase